METLMLAIFSSAYVVYYLNVDFLELLKLYCLGTEQKKVQQN